jgi:hypothetical protein
MLGLKTDKQQQQLKKQQSKQYPKHRVHHMQVYLTQRLKNLREVIRRAIGWLRKPETIRCAFGILRFIVKCARVLDMVSRVLDWINKIHY